MFFDWCLHVIIAVAVVFDRRTGAIEFPRGNDVITAAAIIVRIFSARRVVRLAFHCLRASWVAQDENFVRAFSSGYLVKRWRKSQQLRRRQDKGNDGGANHEFRVLTAAPVWYDISGRNILCSLHPLRCHLKIPRNEHRHCKTNRQKHHERFHDPSRRLKDRQKNRCNRDQQPRDDGINQRNLENVAPL